MINLMRTPFAIVCSKLQDRMAKNNRTKDMITCVFDDIEFTLIAESDDVPETFEEYVEGKHAE